VQDTQKGKKKMLITCEVEIRDILNYLGLSVYDGVYGTLDVESEDGDYTQVLGYESSVVWVHSVPDDLLEESWSLREHRMTCEDPECPECRYYFGHTEDEDEDED